MMEMTIIVKAKNDLILGNSLCGYGFPNLIEFTTETFSPHNQTKCIPDCANSRNLSQHLCIYLKLTDKGDDGHVNSDIENVENVGHLR